MGDGYSIFTQPTGPNINVSLFGDAAKTGAQLGKDIPSPVTAAYEGFQKGIEQDQKNTINDQTIEANDQQAQIRQHQIDQFGTADQIQSEQLRAQKLKNDSEAIDYQEKSNLADQSLTTASAELSKKATEAQKDTNNITRLQSITDLMNNPDTPVADKKRALFSNQDLRAEYPEVFKNFRVPLDRYLNPAEKNALDYIQNDQDAIDQHNKDVAETQEDYKNKLNAITYSSWGVADKVTKSLGKPSQDIFANSELRPDGYYKLDPSNPNKVLLDGQGQPVIDENSANGGKPSSTHTMYYTDPIDKSVQVAITGVSSDFAKDFNAFKDLNLTQSGQRLALTRQQLKENYDNKQKELTAGTATSGKIDTFSKTDTSQKEADIGVESKPIYVSEAQKTFGIPEEHLPAVEPILRDVNNHVIEEVKNAKVRADPASLIKKYKLQDTLGRQLADTDFNMNSYIQNTNTQDQVDAWNQSIKDTFMGNLRQGEGAIFKPLEYLGVLPKGYMDKILNPGFVNTPQELYYAKNQKMYNDKVNQYITVLTNNYDRTINNPARKQAAVTEFQSKL